MGTSSGKSFPTSNINNGHIHYDESTNPARAYMYKGGDPTDLSNSWTEVDLADSPDIFAKLNANGKLPPSSVEVNNIGGITTQDILSNYILSNGLIYGGTVSQGTGNTVNVAACKALVRSSDDATATLYFVTCVATVGLSVPLDATRYIHLNYNSGTPVVTADTTYDDENRTKVYLAEVHNIGGVFHIHNDPTLRGDYTHRLTEYIEGIMNNRVASGEAVSETGTRNLIVTAGVIWDRHINKQITPAFDSSGSDTFSTYYRSGTPGAFTLVTGETQWNNTQYDDGSGSLATLTGGNYGVHFVIRGLSGVVAIMYGEGDYASQALAEAAEAPTLRPEEFDEHGIFIAQLVFLKSAATIAKITSIKPIVGSSGTTGGGTSITLPLAVAQGGTGATTAAAARSNLSVSGGLHPFYQHVGTSQILMPHYVLAASSSLTNQNGAAWAIPLYFEQARTLSALMLNVTTSAATANGIRIALYNSSNGAPSSLLLDAGEVIASSTGIKTLAISQAVSKGVYWIVVLTQSNSAVITGFSGAQMLHIHGSDPAVFTTHRTGIKGNIAYAAAWPDPFNTILWVNSAMPLIGHQLSA